MLPPTVLCGCCVRGTRLLTFAIRQCRLKISDTRKVLYFRFPLYSTQLTFSDQKSLLDDLMKVVKQKEAEDKDVLPGGRSSSSYKYKWLKSGKYGTDKPKFTLYAKDGQLLPVSAIEDQLKQLMLMWEMEDTVKLLRESVLLGIEPNKIIILDLLQQLANLGEVECLLEVHEFLLDRGLTTNLRFYHCLRDAYFNSGRIDEGVAMLRIIYHGTRDFDDADLFFTLLATMTIKYFEHQIPLLESFVNDLEDSDPPVPYARASLWRCFVLAEKFEVAEKIMREHDDVKKMIPAQVTKLLQSPLEIDYSEDVVFQWLINLPQLKPGLRAAVFDALIQHLSDQGEWERAIGLLSNAMDKKMKVHQHTVQIFLTRFFSQLSGDQIQHLTDWAEMLEDISDGTGVD